MSGTPETDAALQTGGPVNPALLADPSVARLVDRLERVAEVSRRLEADRAALAGTVENLLSVLRACEQAIDAGRPQEIKAAAQLCRNTLAQFGPDAPAVADMAARFREPFGG